MSVILKELEILQASEAVANKEKSQKDNKIELQELHQVIDQLIKRQYLFYKTGCYLKFIHNGLSLFDIPANLRKM